LLILGGSLGSGPLNEVAPSLDLPAGTQVLHVAGVAHEANVAAAWSASRTPVRVLGFCDAMQDAYLAADVVLSRSGASTVAELAIAGLPSILVPVLTLQRGEQAANARVLERAGGAVVVAQSDREFARNLQQRVAAMLADDAMRSRMREGARSVARPDAARRLAEVVTSVRTPS
jgi:UDP-N-acetylglucosamine--N-acetylmuramyl-(pentapeptide) pyrophosphoryl-undecaprenol N-acetylglucosamine transferase